MQERNARPVVAAPTVAPMEAIPLPPTPLLPTRQGAVRAAEAAGVNPVEPLGRAGRVVVRDLVVARLFSILLPKYRRLRQFVKI